MCSTGCSRLAAGGASRGEKSCGWSSGSWRTASCDADRRKSEMDGGTRAEGMDGRMGQGAQHTLKEWILAAEVALLEDVGDTAAERFSWLAEGLLRRSPEKLWELLREAGKEETDEVPGLENLLERLAQSLAGVGRLVEMGELIKAARRWEV